jgi:hypothetical protein
VRVDRRSASDDDENTRLGPRGDIESVPPARSRVDTARAVVAALAELDPTGIASAGADLLNHFLPPALERRRQEFYERVARSISQLTEITLDLNERLAVAALAQGTLSAARSATESHLEYLANATARAMTTPEEREADHAMLLLRIAGDISATHVRLLEMYAAPYAVAAKIGKDFEWVKDKHGVYPLMQVPESLDPELAANASFVGALFQDLERLGLVGGEGMERVIDAGSNDSPPDEVTTLGLELLAFVAVPAHDDMS